MEKINEEWKIYKDGTLIHKSGYTVQGETLEDKDWILHLSSKVKSFISLDTFIPAYFKACKNKGINELTIRTGY